MTTRQRIYGKWKICTPSIMIWPWSCYTTCPKRPMAYKLMFMGHFRLLWAYSQPKYRPLIVGRPKIVVRQLFMDPICILYVMKWHYIRRFLISVTVISFSNYRRPYILTTMCYRRLSRKVWRQITALLSKLWPSDLYDHVDTSFLIIIDKI